MKVSFIILLSVVLLSSGCASYLSLDSSRDEIRRERVYASGDQQAIRMVNSGVGSDIAIRAVQLSGDAAGIGIDVGNLEALKKHPVRQVGAAIADLMLLYGAVRGGSELLEQGKSGGNTSAGRDANNIRIDGSGNQVNIGNSTTTVPAE